MTCYCYLLACQDGSIYCGWTTDLERRLEAHNRGKGSRYTRTRLPVVLVYHEAFANRSEAQRREWEIKQMGHSAKLALIKAHGQESA